MKRTPDTATERWQKSAYWDGWAGADGTKSWLRRSDYRYSSQFNPELVKWFNAGWDDCKDSQRRAQAIRENQDAEAAWLAEAEMEGHKFAREIERDMDYTW